MCTRKTSHTEEGDTSWGERCRLRDARLGESAAPQVRYEALNITSVKHISENYLYPEYKK